MSEADVIAAVSRPATVASLVGDLRALGLGEGDTVMVHSSLSALGYVSGGAQAVVLALLEAVGPSGTIAMPAHLVEPEGTGTRLFLEHKGFDMDSPAGRQAHEGMGAGWPTVLARIDGALDVPAGAQP